MLDRKTKDIEASVELLEDRIKQSKGMYAVYAVIGLFFLVIGGILFMTVTSIDFSTAKASAILYLILITTPAYTLLMVVSLFYFMWCVDEENNQRLLKLLIFLKKNYQSDSEEEKKQ